MFYMLNSIAFLILTFTPVTSLIYRIIFGIAIVGDLLYLVAYKGLGAQRRLNRPGKECAMNLHLSDWEWLRVVTSLLFRLARRSRIWRVIAIWSSTSFCWQLQGRTVRRRKGRHQGRHQRRASRVWPVKIPGLVEMHVNINGLPSSNADLMLDTTFESCRGPEGLLRAPRPCGRGRQQGASLHQEPDYVLTAWITRFLFQC